MALADYRRLFFVLVMFFSQFRLLRLIIGNWFSIGHQRRQLALGLRPDGSFG